VPGNVSASTRYQDIEKERGITIKAQSVTLDFKAKDGEPISLILLIRRACWFFLRSIQILAACEGALLVVDAAQGVEAQSVANCYTAIEQGWKSSGAEQNWFASAEPERVLAEIEEVIGIAADEALMISAKTGLGVQDVLEQLVIKVPPPQAT